MTLRIIGWLFGGAVAAVAAAVIYGLATPDPDDPSVSGGGDDSAVSVVIEQDDLSRDGDQASSGEQTASVSTDEETAGQLENATTSGEKATDTATGVAQRAPGANTSSSDGASDAASSSTASAPRSAESGSALSSLSTSPVADSDSGGSSLGSATESGSEPAQGTLASDPGRLASLPTIGEQGVDGSSGSGASGIGSAASSSGSALGATGGSAIQQPGGLDQSVASVQPGESIATQPSGASAQGLAPSQSHSADGSGAAKDDSGREPVDPSLPSFDVVRVDSDGQTVIAGTAAPEERVEVLLDGQVVGEAVADASGQFVAIVFATLSQEAQKLELRTQVPVSEIPSSDGNPEGSEAPSASETTESSDASETASAGSNEETKPEPDPVEKTTEQPGLAEPSDDAPEVATGVGTLDLPATGADRQVDQSGLASGGAGTGPSIAGASSLTSQDGIGGQTSSPETSRPETGSNQRYAVSAPVIILPSNAPDAAPALVQPQRDSLALLQPQARDIAGVVLDSITYSEAGAVVLSGRGIPGRIIRIYANGRSVGNVRVGGDRRWVWTSGVGDAETIKLFRMDEIGSAGEVTSRIETPFEYSRLSPQVVRDRRVVIQRGDMLWRIAEQFYGEGIRYSTIYGANSELIRDPDLIYPGQVFTIPELVDAD